jgi:hypothetical protein
MFETEVVMRNSLLVVAAALLVTGCLRSNRVPAATSHSVLGAERSQLVVAGEPKAVGLEVTRLFAQRRFMLVDYQQDAVGLSLRFKGDRKSITQPLSANEREHAEADQLDADAHSPGDGDLKTQLVAIGSVFHVRITGRGDGTSAVTVIGRATRDGDEICTRDQDLATPCATVYAGATFWREIGGFAEAETIEGVFSELRLEGHVAKQ